MSAEPLRRLSVADELAAALRNRILDGDLPAGTPLREIELTRAYDVSRHTLRTAVRTLASEGLVRIEPNRGASVSRLDADDLRGLYELRTAIEVEAARLALVSNDGRMPAGVHRAAARLTTVCRRPKPTWRDVAAAHAGLHQAIVEASGSSRLAAAYAQLAAELQLFLVQLQPVWSLDRMVSHHEELVTGLETDGTEALRQHLADGLDAVAQGTPRTS